VKKSISQPVTVADNYDWWSHHGAALARELDFVSVHTYPVWEGKDIDEAMPYSITNLQAVRNALPHSRLVITEAGWASSASEFGTRASEEKQKRYYEDLFAWTDKMNITTFFFEAFDEDWKGETNNPLGAEKHWGLFTVDREPKQVMRH
jgi:exo-beta-1,3-glucanase (GH17 family)